ncbi:MAG TPA: hypothetical protein VFX61_11760 [Micromonosporaceae bacterium]|nr:hypothetical protein [Micromonosporaceae bacterium]
MSTRSRRGMGRNLLRSLNLFVGLALFGISIALMVRAELGLASWDVLHQGIAMWTGLPLGWIVNGVAVLVLLLWIPLRQRPGLGTISNVIMVGLAVETALRLLPPVEHLAARVGLLILAIVLNGVATGLYIGARFGPGPRDGLMTGLAARGYSIRAVRTVIEFAVLSVGWLLGGTVGVGTLLYAAAIGPLAHYLIPKLTISDKNHDVLQNPEGAPQLCHA